MDLLALSIPSTVFLSQFSIIALCTVARVKYMTSLSPVFGTQNRKCPKENLNLRVFYQGEYCNFLGIFCRLSHDVPVIRLFGVQSGN